MPQNHMLRPTVERLLDAQTDITQPTGPVDVKFDDKRGVLWVNVNGVCVLRICQTTSVSLEHDGRTFTYTKD
jgi:hypothetical protein